MSRMFHRWVGRQRGSVACEKITRQIKFQFEKKKVQNRHSVIMNHPFY